MKLSAILFLCIALTSAYAAEPFGGGEPVQSRTSFEAAIHSLTLEAQSYVLITVVDASTESVRSICTKANFLLGALHYEYGIGYDGVG
jgi:hypothetical protein